MSGDDRSSDLFRVAVELDATETVLTLSGELDRASAPDLAKILNAVVERRRGFVVLDLGELDFIDASGLNVIAVAARDLADQGETLVLRNSSNLVIRLLDLTAMTDNVRLESSPADPDRLGAEEIGSYASVNLMGAFERSAEEIARVMAIPADTDVVEAALRLVVNLARATVGGADGVSVSLLREGRVMTVAASDQTVRDMDAYQYATGEGPCLDASLEGRWFHAASLDQETRWPAFTPQARALGILAILSSPLVVRDRPVGALNIYSRTAVVFTAREQELAAVYAVEVSKILADAGIDVATGAWASRLRLALQRRHVLALALGVLMEREGISEEDAFALLRQFSQDARRPLGERVEDVVASTRRTEHGSSFGPSP